ncbi:MAG: SRPBCC family protein [Acidobacteria bacterium]|nr:SRPBCC family protein [Acidobacteriota bacterium]
MTGLGTVIDSHAIRFERLLPGPVERVWDYLTKSECLVTWLAEGEIDPRAGGQVELRFDVHEVPERAKAGAIIRGVVARFEPPRVLAYSWVDASADRPPAESPDPVVTFELEGRGSDALLVLTHRQLPTALMPGFGAGLHTHLGILHARLRGEQPEPFLAVFRRLLPIYAQQVAAPRRSNP